MKNTATAVPRNMTATTTQNSIRWLGSGMRACAGEWEAAGGRGGGRGEGAGRGTAGAGASIVEPS